MKRFLVPGFGYMLLYLLFAGSLSPSEIGTAVVLAIVVAAFSAAVARAASVRFAFSFAHARIWVRQLAGVPLATARTGAALARSTIGRSGSTGRAEERPFRYGAVEQPAERARRATAVLAASLSPESYVVRSGPELATALIHGIDRRPACTDAEWLA